MDTQRSDSGTGSRPSGTGSGKMADDIEHLKIHKIDPTTGRLRLQVAGQVEAENISEAFGGHPDTAAPASSLDDLRERVIEALKTVRDPEIPLNVYDLGLIYGVDVTTDGEVEITMTLTAPACPVAGMIVRQVATAAGDVPGVRRSHAKLVWDPPWTKDRMSDEAKLELGLL